jgi:hypothetical protein
MEAEFRGKHRAPSASRPAVEHERERSHSSERGRSLLGSLRPSRIVSSAAGAGTRAAAASSGGGVGRVLALLARLAAS